MQIINPYNIPLNNVVIKGRGKLIIGSNVEIREYTVIESGDGHVEIGNNSIIGYHSFIQATGKLVIGNNSLLGPHCSYICSSHQIKRGINVRDMSMIRGLIDIKNNVWIGANCTVNYNTTLNDGCVVGANSFVKANVPSWEIWGGSPAKFIKAVS